MFLGCDTAKALDLTNILETDGFAKLKGRGRSERLLGKVDRRYLLYDVVKSVATEQLKEDYFNPLKYIGHAVSPKSTCQSRWRTYSRLNTNRLFFVVCPSKLSVDYRSR